MKRLNSATKQNFGNSNPHGASQRGITRRSAKRRGAVLVEAAAATIFIVLPMLLGIIQFGIYYSASNGVTQAAREGARYAAVYGLRPDLTDDFIKGHAIDAARAGNVKLTLNDITITPPRASRTQYTPVTVSINYNMNAKRILRIYSPGTINRTAQSMLE